MLGRHFDEAGIKNKATGLFGGALELVNDCVWSGAARTFDFPNLISDEKVGCFGVLWRNKFDVGMQKIGDTFGGRIFAVVGAGCNVCNNAITGKF